LRGGTTKQSQYLHHQGAIAFGLFYGWILHALEIMPDHVHIFVQADHTTAPVEIAKTMKSISAVHIFNTHIPHFIM
jgi:REP element-mobilizing transposase RayT